MLAMSLPVPISYDIPTTIVSVVPAIFAAVVCLTGAIRGTAPWLIGGGLVMGVGIGAMHYVGMAAMLVGADMLYDLGLFALSIAVAASFAIASLYTVSWSLHQTEASPAAAIGVSGAIMGLAVTAMHYVGMWAASFMPLTAGSTGMPAAGMDPIELAIPVALAILVIVALAVSAVAMDHRFKQLREAASSEAAKFDHLLEAVPDGVVGINAGGIIRLLNSRIEVLFRYPKESLIGRPFETLMPGFAASGAYERPAITDAVGSDSRLKLSGLRIDQSVFPAEISMNRIATPDGPLVICAIRDVTEQERARLALRAANEQLTAGMKDLESQSQELRLLTEMGELLHSCEEEREAYEVINTSLVQLLPAMPGAVYMLSRSRNVLQMTASWGGCTTALMAVFNPTECWALRRGRMYIAATGQAGIRCDHAEGHQDGYVCVPMLAHGEVLGILHVLARAPDKQVEKSADLTLERKRILLVAVAEKISTAIASLRLREELRNQSIRDPLTGLLNRRFMEEAVEREIVRATRTSTRLSFVALDLDHFKRFNDTFGHEGGDLVLREVGAVLSKIARGDNLACRLGGEELMMILPDTPLDDAIELAEKVRQKIEKLSIRFRDQQLGKITASFGVAEFPSHGEGHREVLRAADQALYRAKAGGRNRVESAKRAEDTLSVSIKAMVSPP
jgi:diguanylate cyclase (GGDEF)-like protein/PAS domain S-box-containing protein